MSPLKCIEVRRAVHLGHLCTVDAAWAMQLEGYDTLLGVTHSQLMAWPLLPTAKVFDVFLGQHRSVSWTCQMGIDLTHSM